MAYFLTKSRVRMAVESNVRSLARALARRDITVPAGQSKIVAISSPLGREHKSLGPDLLLYSDYE
jgi:hypothetical protein